MSEFIHFCVWRTARVVLWELGKIKICNLSEFIPCKEVVAKKLSAEVSY